MAAAIPLDEFPAWLGKVAEKTTRELARGVTNGAQVLAGEIAQAVFNSPQAPSPASIRTGNLARSYLQGVTFLGKSGSKVSAKTSSRLPYARIQDTGGFIRPSTRQYLSVPLTMEAAKRWPRDWPRGKGGLFLIRSRRGNLILAKKSGKRGLTPVYVLKKQVQIDGKFYLSKAWQNAAPKIDNLIGDALIAPIGRV